MNEIIILGVSLRELPVQLWLNGLLLVSGVWLVLLLVTVYIRRVRNLTPVEAAVVNPDAKPDFLSVDHEARQAALDRGAAYDAKLRRRTLPTEPETLGFWQRSSGLVALAMSIVSIIGMGIGLFCEIGQMEPQLQTYLSADRMQQVFSTHPVAFSIAALVIVANIVIFCAKQLTPQANS